MKSRGILFSALVPLLSLSVAASLQIFAISAYEKSNASVFVTLLLSVLSGMLAGGVYLLNRFTDDDSVAYPERTCFFNEARWLVLVAVAMLTAPIFILMLLGMYNPLPVFITGAIIGVLYSVKIVPLPLPWKKGEIFISLKEVPLLKNVLVAILWGGSALAITVFNDDPLNFLRTDIMMLFLTFFLTNMNSTIACDMRDEEGDRFKNVVTLPTKLGVNGTGILLAVQNVVGIMILLFIGAQGHLRPVVTGFCCLCVFWAWAGQLPFFVNRLKNISRASHELLIDSHLLVSSAGLVLIAI